MINLNLTITSQYQRRLVDQCDYHMRRALPFRFDGQLFRVVSVHMNMDFGNRCQSAQIVLEEMP